MANQGPLLYANSTRFDRTQAVGQAGRFTGGRFLFSRGVVTGAVANGVSTGGVSAGIDYYDTKLRGLQDSLGFTKMLTSLEKAEKNSPAGPLKDWLLGKLEETAVARDEAIRTYQYTYDYLVNEGIELKIAQDEAYKAAKGIADSRLKLIESKYTSSVSTQLHQGETAKLQGQVKGYF
jgi:hypothetical protein